MTSDIGKLRNDAAKLLGWHKEGPTAEHPDYAELWCDRDGDFVEYIGDDDSSLGFRPDTDANQAALLLAEIERQGRKDLIMSRLVYICGGAMSHDPVNGYCLSVEQLWAIANATPLQKTRAAVEAMTAPTS